MSKKKSKQKIKQGSRIENIKEAKNSLNPRGNKNPKHLNDPTGFFDWNPSWSFSRCDFDHEFWSLNNSDIINDIIPKLSNFEKLKWKEIIQDKEHNHWIYSNKLIKAAQDRINEKNWCYDQLFSLRLGGKMRLFGHIENGIYYIIWYDENHEICPSNKKHT